MHTLESPVEAEDLASGVSLGNWKPLLPSTATVHPQSGQLCVGGVALRDIASQYGTPVVVYDEAHLRQRCAELNQAFPDGASYASKAFLCLAMAQLVASEGLDIDVASIGELVVVLAAGVPGSRVVMHGNNKSTDELRAALAAGVGRLVVDSDDELDRLQGLLDDEASHGNGPGEPVPVLIRVNPAITPRTHAHVSTGQAAAKFGFRVDTGDADRAAQRIVADPRLHLVGTHVHVGSQLLDVADTADAAYAAAGLAVCHGLAEVSVGGGLGIQYTREQTAPTVRQWAAAVTGAARRAGFSGRVTAEPGRSLVGTAAVTVYRVGTLKPVRAARPASKPGGQVAAEASPEVIAAIDGGLSDNPRPALYGARYEALRASSPVHRGPSRMTRVVGKNCESGDTLIPQLALPADLAVDDLLVIPATGAYTHAMASNYNKLPRPAVVFVAGGQVRLVVRRESDTDLYRLDLPLTDTGTGRAFCGLDTAQPR